MKPNLPIVIFSDADRFLFDTARVAAAASMLHRLAREQMALVLCSSKTRAELEYIQQGLGVRHPFVCENGGAVVFPSGYFRVDIPRARELPGYRAVEFGRPYRDVVDMLQRTAARLRIEIVGFNDMSVEEVARDCNLPLLLARLAKLREYEELFRILDPSLTARRRLFRALQGAGLRCTNGRRYDHVGAAVDKGLGMDLLCGLYRRIWGPTFVVGITDAVAETRLLQLVDYRMIVHDDDSTTGAVDVVDWARAVVDVVLDLRRDRGALASPRSRQSPG